MPNKSHILTNPVWNALKSGNANLARGNDNAMYFDTEISPFVALRNIDSTCLNSLYEILPIRDISILACAQVIDMPVQWQILAIAQGYQMVYKGVAGDMQRYDLPLTDLSARHIGDMMNLTQLTNPGPFSHRTIEFGHYQGAWNGHQLVAMAGQRMQPYNYAEISAVCTHPDHAGKGYARELIAAQVIRMQAANLTPFLHVRQDNERALKLYEQLGFAIRSDMYFHVFKKR